MQATTTYVIEQEWQYDMHDNMYNSEWMYNVFMYMHAQTTEYMYVHVHCVCTEYVYVYTCTYCIICIHVCTCM